MRYFLFKHGTSTQLFEHIASIIILQINANYRYFYLNKCAVEWQLINSLLFLL